jgi:predicted amidophosphoribosyltransferase
MTNVFGIVPGELRHIVDKQVLLVDDVYTTGATLEEAAVLLRKVGAKAVWGLVLAKS